MRKGRLSDTSSKVIVFGGIGVGYWGLDAIDHADMVVGICSRLNPLDELCTSHIGPGDVVVELKVATIPVFICNRYTLSHNHHPFCSVELTDLKNTNPGWQRQSRPNSDTGVRIRPNLNHMAQIPRPGPFGLQKVPALPFDFAPPARGIQAFHLPSRA